MYVIIKMLPNGEIPTMMNKNLFLLAHSLLLEQLSSLLLQFSL